MVHLATLLAVLIYFRAEFVLLIRGVLHLILRVAVLDTPEARLAWLVIISSIPAALAGLLIASWIDELFGSPPVVAVALLVTGAILYVAEKSSGVRTVARAAGPRMPGLIGIAQAVALIPGISRSGATIAAGMATRHDPRRGSALCLCDVHSGHHGSGRQRSAGYADRGRVFGFLGAARGRHDRGVCAVAIWPFRRSSGMFSATACAGFPCIAGHLASSG